MSSPPVSLDHVTTALRDLLDQADLLSTTESDLEKRLEEVFGCDMAQHRALIESEVEKFVLEQAQAADAAHPGNKRSQPDAPSRVPEPKAAKRELDNQRARASSSMQAGGGDFALTGDGMIRCSVRDFKGKPYVDLRTFYMKGDERLPGKKGLMLTPDQWSALAAGLPLLADALAAGRTDACVELNSNRRATISDFKKNALAVDVREWYEKDAALAPGQKGISLSSSAFAELGKHADAISEAAALAVTTSSTRAVPKQESKTKVESKTEPSAPQAAASASGQAMPAASAMGAQGSGEGPQTEVSASGETLWKLGGSKFASVSTFKGKRMVGLREHYQKDGKWLPGKKGISLGVDQFAALREGAETMTAALEAKNTSVEVPLSAMRKASVSSFKGKLYVNVREYYDKDGALAPGMKGLALDGAQWTTLCAALDTLHAEASS